MSQGKIIFFYFVFIFLKNYDIISVYNYNYQTTVFLTDHRMALKGFVMPVRHIMEERRKCSWL